MNFMTFHILGMSSSQLTFIFFRGVAQPPTSVCTCIIWWITYIVMDLGYVRFSIPWHFQGKTDLKWSEHFHSINHPFFRAPNSEPYAVEMKPVQIGVGPCKFPIYESNCFMFSIMELQDMWLAHISIIVEYCLYKYLSVYLTRISRFSATCMVFPGVPSLF